MWQKYENYTKIYILNKYFYKIIEMYEIIGKKIYKSKKVNTYLIIN